MAAVAADDMMLAKVAAELNVGEQPYMLNARDVVAEKDSFVNPDGDQCSHDLQDVLCSPSCPPGCCNDICVKRFGQNAKGVCTGTPLGPHSPCVCHTC
ncbi:hypothetical protein Tco_0548271 [Tanacetum coccineum]